MWKSHSDWCFYVTSVSVRPAAVAVRLSVDKSRIRFKWVSNTLEVSAHEIRTTCHMTGLMSWTRMKHCVNMDASRVSLVVWIISGFDLKLRIARISRLVSQYVYSRREGTEGKGPPVGREGSRNRCRPRGHTKDYICLQGREISCKGYLDNWYIHKDISWECLCCIWEVCISF